MKYIQPNWPAPKQIRAYTTLRNGWNGSKKIDDISRLQQLLHMPQEEPIWLTQTHSPIVIEATTENKDKTADASFTAQKQRVCVVLTADCLPILICNKNATHVAAIHAGWRGLARGIIEATLDKLKQPSEELLIWLGPAIGPQKFEVGKDVYDAFVNTQPKSSSAFMPFKEGKWLANLYALARLRLEEQGMTQIYGGEYCTYTQNDLFFSYRRDQGNTGRMASLIWISDN